MNNTEPISNSEYSLSAYHYWLLTLMAKVRFISPKNCPELYFILNYLYVKKTVTSVAQNSRIDMVSFSGIINYDAEQARPLQGAG